MQLPTKLIKILLLMAGCYCTSCHQLPSPNKALLTDAGLLHRNTDQLTTVIIYDVFSPPVASRIYAYTSLAAYEALRFQNPGTPSLVASLKGFKAMPLPQQNKTYNYLLSATKAYFTVAEKITFSIDTLRQYEAKVYQQFQQLLPEDVYSRSISFGDTIGKQILLRTTVDNYKQTRGMPRFLGSNEPGQWRPTPPDYLDGAEPWWARIKPLAMDTNTQFACLPPPPFTADTTGTFFTAAKEVYNITTHLTSAQIEVARYWDDNPFVMEHTGHLMFGNKKITPVGHWMGITAIACKKADASAVQTATAYALTATAIFDAIISCWKTKYEHHHIRPITVINETIDKNWRPLLQTPPFPEHPSGHSSISAAAAAVLTGLFGDAVAFEDTSDLAYIGMKRNFTSFKQAADEASISRVYGGIHFTSGVVAGAKLGSDVGAFVVQKFRVEKFHPSMVPSTQGTGSQ